MGSSIKTILKSYSRGPINTFMKKHLGHKRFTAVTGEKAFTSQDWYDIFLKTGKEGFCIGCKKPTTFINILSGYAQVCSRSPCDEAKRILKTRQETTMIEKYGTKNPSNVRKFQSKRKKTFQVRYGVDNPYQSKEIKERIKEINKERYGVEHPMHNQAIAKKVSDKLLLTFADHIRKEKIQSQQRKTSNERYGADYFMSTPTGKAKVTRSHKSLYGYKRASQGNATKAKTKKTNIQRYGVPYIHQNAEILDRVLSKRYTRKQMKIGKKTYFYQGYEDMAIRYYVNKGLKVINTVKKVPPIDYKFQRIYRKYFPDLYLPEIATIVEVKSEYTISVDKKKNIAKFKAAIISDFKFILALIKRTHYNTRTVKIYRGKHALNFLLSL